MNLERSLIPRILFTPMSSQRNVGSLPIHHRVQVQGAKKKQEFTQFRTWAHVAKRAVTKQCPVCDEWIPLRLLASHSQLELQRVDEMYLRIPSPAPEDPLYEIDPSSEQQAGPSTRRAAIRARQSITPKLRTAARTSAIGMRTTPSNAESTIRLLQRNRRARHTKTKELSRAVLEDLDGPTRGNNTNNAQGDGHTHLSTCPVCQTEITTGETLSEHVDRCLAEMAASEAFRNEMGAALDSGTGTGGLSTGDETYQFNGETRIRVTALAGFSGTGFSVRDRTAHDVDDELDIEGSDEEVFGNAQFTEGDILPLQPDDDIDIEDNDNGDDHGVSAPGPSTTSTIPSASIRGISLRDLVAAGKRRKRRTVTLTNPSVPLKRSGDTDELVRALERKIKVLESSSHPQVPLPHLHASSLSSPVCRICLESYTDPRYRWHAGTFSAIHLCPICKHISAASNLRRIYL
ncbi:hypothetical protein BS47DRAFT_1354796 [Hydnum rufescens UP504]|uniref:UBZ4-type domain-containing protein n=1 Tax=Hydnum rufescens UP504 TaxID=1448309 RepID=A0A9P6AGX6_9AGAM|nr:hypothetical protein BS47DRAFT_1354796 [Hydnum rufescens UP504]